MTRKVLVTGGAGFIGSHIIDALVAEGCDVHSLDSAEPTRYRNEKAVYHMGDIRDVAVLKNLMQGAQCVFHEAALPRVQYSIENPIETFGVNVDGTVAVLTAATEAGVKRVVFASSAAVYGDQETMPLTEDMPAVPKSPYALHKYIGERTCALWSDLYKLETVCLRYFNVYGPRLDPNGAYALAIGKFLRLRSEGKPIEIWGSGENTRDFVHVHDIARANVAAMISLNVGKGEVINIGTGRETSVNTLASLIGGTVEHVEARHEPGRACAAVGKAKELLNWEAKIPLEEGIAELKKEFGVV